MLSPSLANFGFEGFRDPKAVIAGSEIYYFKVVNNFSLSHLRKHKNLIPHLLLIFDSVPNC